MNIKLLGDRVLIEKEKVEQKTASGLIINKETSPDSMQMGVIVKVGNGRFEAGVYITPDVKEGDRVMYNYGTMINYLDKSYVLVNVADIIMVI